MKKISQHLREERLAQKYTLEEVERNTKIKLVYLRAIEDGKFTDLPSKTYAQGFVKNYAKFLGIPAEKAIPLFRREYEAQQREEFMPRFRKTQDKIGKRKVLNIKYGVFGVLALIIVGFLIFQLSSFFQGPQLEIEQPQEGDRLVGNIIRVEGTTDPSATVLVNEEEAYVGLDGKFEKSIYLFEGARTINVEAINRFENSSKKEVSVTVVREE